MKQIQKVISSLLAVVMLVCCFSVTAAAASVRSIDAKTISTKAEKRIKKVSAQIVELGYSLENTADMIGTEPDETELATTDFDALYTSYAKSITGELTLTAREFQKDYNEFLEKNFDTINKKILMPLGIDASDEGKLLLQALSTVGDAVTHTFTNGVIAVIGGAAALVLVFFNGVCMPFLTVRSGPRVINYFGPKAYAALYALSNDGAEVARNSVKR